MIRIATDADAMEIVALGKRFSDAAAVGLPFSGAYALARAKAMIADPNAVVILWDDGRPRGVLAGALMWHPLYAVRSASELIWWIDAEARGHAARPMLRAFDAWAEERGAELIQMAELDDRVGALYRRAGFEAMPERHWWKRLA
jgi:hypothetical protein